MKYVLQEAFRLLVSLSQNFSEEHSLIIKASILFVHNMAQEKGLHKELVEQGKDC